MLWKHKHKHARKTIEAENPDKVFDVGTISCVPLCQKHRFFRWLAGCLAHSDKAPQIKSTAPEKGIIANNLFHFDGLDQQILEGTWKIWGQLRSWRFKGKSSDISLDVHLESQIYGLQHWVFMQQKLGEKDVGY